MSTVIFCCSEQFAKKLSCSQNMAEITPKMLKIVESSLRLLYNLNTFVGSNQVQGMLVCAILECIIQSQFNISWMSKSIYFRNG